MDEIRVHTEAGLEMCSAECRGAGHRVHPIQHMVATTTPSSWVDALAFSRGEVVELIGLDGSTRTLWHHRELELASGEPVAFHPVAGVLAVRGALLNVGVR